MPNLPLINGVPFIRTDWSVSWVDLTGDPPYVSATYVPGDISKYARFDIAPDSPLGALPATLQFNITHRYTPDVTGTPVVFDTLSFGDGSGPFPTNQASMAFVAGAESYLLDTSALDLATFNAGGYSIYLGYHAYPSSYDPLDYSVSYTPDGNHDNNGSLTPWSGDPPYAISTGVHTGVPFHAAEDGTVTVNVTGPDGWAWISYTATHLGSADFIDTMPPGAVATANATDSLGLTYADTGPPVLTMNQAIALVLPIVIASGVGTYDVGLYSRMDAVSSPFPGSNGVGSASVNLAATPVDPDPSTLTISALSLMYDATGGGSEITGTVAPKTQQADDDMIKYLDEDWTFWVSLSQYSTGSAMDATGSPVFGIYEPGNDTPLLTGSMTLKDASNTDGFYEATVSLSALNGFVENTEYVARVGATVDSISQGGIAANGVIVIRAEPATATGVASEVWSYPRPVLTAGRETTMGGLVNQQWAYFFNQNSIQGSIQRIYLDDSMTVMVEGAQSATDTTAFRGKLT